MTRQSTPRTLSTFREELTWLAAGAMPAEHFQDRWGAHIRNEPHRVMPPAKLPDVVPEGYRPWPSAENFVTMMPTATKGRTRAQRAEKVKPVPVVLPADAAALTGSSEPPSAFLAAERQAIAAEVFQRRERTVALLPDGRVQVNWGLLILGAYAWWQVVLSGEPGNAGKATFSHAWRRAAGQRWQISAADFKRLCKGEAP